LGTEEKEYEQKDGEGYVQTYETWIQNEKKQYSPLCIKISHFPAHKTLFSLEKCD
jgi:hypothetical protein